MGGTKGPSGSYATAYPIRQVAQMVERSHSKREAQASTRHISDGIDVNTFPVKA